MIRGAALQIAADRCTTRNLLGLTLFGSSPLKIVVIGCCQACKGYRWQSQGAYRSALARAIQAALGVVRDPYPRHPWDPRAVSDPWLLADEFPELFAVAAREARSARGSAAVVDPR